MGKLVIGVLHVPPLPGAPRYGGDMEAVKAAVLADAEALHEGGVDALVLENFGDVPFYPGRVPAAVVAQMTALAVEVRRRFDVSLGINVLRNDGVGALAVAAASGADFIRVNVLCGARVTDQGIIQGIAHELLRDRARLGAERVKIYADVNVKHSAPIGPISVEEEARDLIDRGLADALIVSGSGTGQPTDPAEVRTVREAVGGVPILVGSGVTVETVSSFLPEANGFVVGTALKRDGIVANAVDPARVRAFVAEVRKRTGRAC